MSTTTVRKVRGDAKLEQLNAEQQERLRGWLEANSYDRVAKFVAQEFGISVGKSTVALYWQRHVLPLQQQEDAELAAALTALPAGDFDAATLQQVRALAFSALAQPFPDIDRAIKLLAVVRKAEQQALARQRHADQHEIALKRLALEERRLALRERLAGLATTKNTKGHERVGESAGVAGNGARAEMAAKAQRGEGRSEGSEEANPLRFPGYSGLVRPEEEAESPANYANTKAESETTKDTKRPERVGGSAGAAGRDEHAEVATKARSCEGLSKGEEETSNLAAPVVEPAPLAETALLVPPTPFATIPQLPPLGDTSSSGSSAPVEVSGLAGDGEVARCEAVPSLHSLTLAATKGGGLLEKETRSAEGGSGAAPATKAPEKPSEAEIAQAMARGEILRGMTPKQVLLTWGQPQLRGANIRDYIRSDFWLYRTETQETRVDFDRDVVSTWSVSARGQKAKEPTKPKP